MDGKKNDTREQRSWDAYLRDGGNQCAAYFCSRRGWGESSQLAREFCAAHQWEGVWYEEAYAQDETDSWWTEQLSDYETQARQSLKAAIVAQERSSRAATHKLALLAIKALHRLPLDTDNDNGGTWRGDLEIAVRIAFETED